MGFQQRQGDAEALKSMLADVKKTIKEYKYKSVFGNPDTKELYYDELRAKKAGRYRKISAEKIMAARSWDEIFSTEKPKEETPKAAAKKTGAGTGANEGK